MHLETVRVGMNELRLCCQLCFHKASIMHWETVRVGMNKMQNLVLSSWLGGSANLCGICGTVGAYV